VQMRMPIGSRQIQENMKQDNHSPVLQKAKKRLGTLPSEKAPRSTRQTTRPQPRSKKPRKRTLEIFYSYSHKDEKLRDKLETHLVMLRREGLITNWHDRRIGPAKEWQGEIDNHLDQAQIILLLVSASFLASNYIYDIEVERAMKRHERGEACVIPIILRPCDWQAAPFSKLQSLPIDLRPVTAWRDRDLAFTGIAQAIAAVVEELRASFTIK